MVGGNQRQVWAEVVTINDARREITRKVNVKFGRSYSLKILSKKVLSCVAM